MKLNGEANVINAVYHSYFQCNLCQKTFSGIQDLELHNCPAARKPSTAAPPSGDTSQLSILPQLREVRLPEKHALVVNPIDDQDGASLNKKPRLTILPQQMAPQPIPVKSIMNHTSGGIVTVSKAPVQSAHHHGGEFFLISTYPLKMYISGNMDHEIEIQYLSFFVKLFYCLL